MNNITEAQSTEQFYGKYLYFLNCAIEYIVAQTDIISKQSIDSLGRDIIESVKFRIKSPESMRDKLIKHGIEINAENAVSKVYDAAGVRIVTSFLEDVEVVAEYIRNIPGLKVIEEKDYINHPKRNGYRSYHMICEFLLDIGAQRKHIYAEIQLRTIAMDTWASVEHRIKYKKYVVDDKLIVSELKRCADELASVDLSLQALRDIISGGMENEDFICGGRESNVRCSCGNPSA